MSPAEITVRGPDGESVTALFGEATPEQLIPCAELVFSAWGKGIDREKLLEYERLFAAQPLTRDGGLRQWCVYRADKPAKVFATCKTIRRPVLVREKQPVQGYKTTEEKAYCVAAVVSDGAYRRQGIAAFMMKQLAKWLDGPGEAVASVLYSAVGEYYAKVGWELANARTETKTILQVNSGLPWEQLDLMTAGKVDNDCVSDLSTRDIKSMREEFDQLNLAHGETAICVLPTPEILGLQHAKSEYIGTWAAGVPPDVKGANCNPLGTWVYWCHNFLKRRLLIQRVRLPMDRYDQGSTISGLTALIKSAINEAARWQLETVEIWSAPPEMQQAIEILHNELGIEFTTQERPTADLVSVRWKGDAAKKTVVYANEYYAYN